MYPFSHETLHTIFRLLNTWRLLFFSRFIWRLLEGVLKRGERLLNFSQMEKYNVL